VSRLLPILLLLLAGTAGAGEVDPGILAGHRDFLDSPELGSRLAGGPGLAPAARYISVELRRLGFTGVGRNGSFFLPVTCEFVEPAPACLVALRRGERSRVLAPGDDFTPFRFSGQGDARGPVVVLTREVAPREPLKGSVVLLVVDGESEEYVAGASAKAAAAGAVAVLVAIDPRAALLDRVFFTDGRTRDGKVKDRGAEFDFLPRGGTEWEALSLADVERILFDVSPGLPIPHGARLKPTHSLAIPVVAVAPSAVTGILDQPLLEWLTRADEKDGLLALGGIGARALVRFATEKRTLLNVAGRRKGADPARASETVVIAARYDEAGEGDDSAACALAVLEAIERGAPAPRSTLALFFVSGERAELDRGGLTTGKAPLTGVSGWVPVTARGGDLLEVSSHVLETFRRLSMDPRLAKSSPAKPNREPAPAEADPEPAPPSTLAAARLARQERRLEQARASIDGALAADPANADLVLERGRIRLAAGDFDGARADAAKLQELHPAGDGRADLLRSEIAKARGDDTGSDLLLDRAASAGLVEALIRRAWRRNWFERGGALFAGQDLGNAIAQTAEESAFGALARGMYAYLNGEDGSARKLLTSALDLDPGLALAYHYRARARLREPEDLEGAVEDTNRAIALGLDEPILFFNRGMAHLRLKMLTLSIEDFEEYARRAPDTVDTPNAVYNIACAQALMGNREEALIWLGRALEAGFVSFDHARVDPDLESIRDDPRFERILASTDSE
jgi:tetratricopeptide (TPR) repeat protein